MERDFARVQISLRRWRVAGVIGFSLAVVGMTALALELRDLRRRMDLKPEAPSEFAAGQLRCGTLVADTIRVNQIEIPGADGRLGASLHSGGLALRGPGRGEISLFVGPNSQHLSLSGNGKRGMDVSVDSEGVPSISLWNSTGEAAKFSVGPLGDAFVQVRNRKGGVRVIAADE